MGTRLSRLRHRTDAVLTRVGERTDAAADADGAALAMAAFLQAVEAQPDASVRIVEALGGPTLVATAEADWLERLLAAMDRSCTRAVLELADAIRRAQHARCGGAV